ncbi:MAG: transcriptional repressor [Acidobacteria bacterium]|nr:transcriptional repressor [Acidobacteriota bacterium]MCL5288308.1 transcriptional repressor [Acidobacteriota bacterium]
MPQTAHHSTSLHLTPHRAAVLAALRARRYHPTAAEVFRMVRRRRPGVSFATIYNALNWLTSRGLIAELQFGDDASRYDSVTESHEHLICKRCGALEDVELGLPADFWARTRQMGRRRFGFQVQNYRLEFLGLCSGCSGGARLKASRSHAGTSVC